MGRVTYILAQLWENAPETFFLACRTFTPCVFTQNAPIFVQNSNVGEKHEKKLDPLTQPVGPWLLAHPSVTCHPITQVGPGGGGGAG